MIVMFLSRVGRTRRMLSPLKRPRNWLQGASPRSFVLLSDGAVAPRLALRKLPSPPGATLFMGHAAAYSPLAKHRYEETNARALGPVYRYRNYTKNIVVVNDPALQQEVTLPCSPWILSMALPNVVLVRRA